MGLQIGQRVGSYEIIALLGKGGMGEVYHTRDAKLKREVAIKVLPDEFAADGERLSRFQREAEALAALNHQNIAGIYDLQQRGDFPVKGFGNVQWNGDYGTSLGMHSRRRQIRNARLSQRN